MHVERVLLDNQYLNVLPKLSFFFSDAIIPELMTGQVKEQVLKNAVQKTMENMLKKLNKSSTTTLSLGGSLYLCGVSVDECVRATPLAIVAKVLVVTSVTCDIIIPV